MNHIENKKNFAFLSIFQVNPLLSNKFEFAVDWRDFRKSTARKKVPFSFFFSLAHDNCPFHTANKKEITTSQLLDEKKKKK